MAISKEAGRQTPLVAVVPFTYATLSSDAGVAEAAFDVPAGATVIGGYVIVDTVFDSTTSDVLDVGDGVDDDEYTATAVNLQALGATALTITGYKYTTRDTIDVEWTAGATGTATQGAGRIVLEYIIEDRATETQPVV